LDHKAVFIGSARFSGSTLLDLMLGNGERCFSTGEVKAYFRPRKRSHLSMDCSCGNPECGIWSEAKKKGEKELYDYLCDSQNSDTIIDSSKNIDWIKDQQKYTGRRFDHKYVLVYKHPLNYLFSNYKRGYPIYSHRGLLGNLEILLRNGEVTDIERWGRYYSRFLSSFDCVTVSFEDLTRRPDDILSALCEEIGMKYFKGKKNFWEKQHHILYGNNSTRIHLYEKDSELYEKHLAIRNRKKNNKIKEDIKGYRTIYYSDKWRKELPEKYRRLVTPEVAAIYEKLESIKMGG